MLKTKPKIGDHISFWASRITKGNPVTGYLTEETDEWITVKLTKDIEGISTTWNEGATKQFRKSLIGIITVKKQKTKSNGS